MRTSIDHLIIDFTSKLKILGSVTLSIILVKKSDVLREKVKAIDFDKISTVADLVDAYKDSSVQSRALATCAIAYENALKD